jgi:hypothetical protein
MLDQPKIQVHINYLDKENLEFPYLVLPTVPRVGDFIILEGGKKYKVTAVIFDDRFRGATKVFIEVKFDAVAAVDL